jgi:hypothetical protein
VLPYIKDLLLLMLVEILMNAWSDYIHPQVTQGKKHEQLRRDLNQISNNKLTKLYRGRNFKSVVFGTQGLLTMFKIPMINF